MELLRMNPALAGQDGIAVTVGRISSFPLHSHSYYELLLYPAFDGSVSVSGHSIPLTEPIAVLMTPADLHGISYGGEPYRECVKIAFTEDTLGLCLARRLTGALTARDAAVTELLRTLAAAGTREDRVILLRAAVLLILMRGTPAGEPSPAAGNALTAKATAIIGDSFTEELTLRGLAERLNVSYQHLSETFVRGTGMTFSAYLSDVRLRNARALLTETELSVTEICYASGYRSLSHFLRAFKRRFGETPRGYRQRAAEMQNKH